MHLLASLPPSNLTPTPALLRYLLVSTSCPALCSLCSLRFRRLSRSRGALWRASACPTTQRWCCRCSVRDPVSQAAASAPLPSCLPASYTCAMPAYPPACSPHMPHLSAHTLHATLFLACTHPAGSSQTARVRLTLSSSAYWDMAGNPGVHDLAVDLAQPAAGSQLGRLLGLVRCPSVTGLLTYVGPAPLA